MYIFLMIIHVIVCFVLIMVVLLQAGRGGGFSDMLGGGQPQSLFGTQTNDFMVRATEVCAILFVVTSLSLAIISTQRGKSLVARQKLMHDIQASVPAAVPQAPPTPPQAAQNVVNQPPIAVPAAPASSAAAAPAPENAR